MIVRDTSRDFIKAFRGKPLTAMDGNELIDVIQLLGERLKAATLGPDDVLVEIGNSVIEGRHFWKPQAGQS